MQSAGEGAIAADKFLPMRWLKLRLFLPMLTLAGASAVPAATYDVGPGRTLTSLFGVPWKSLQPGDVVNIYPKAGGYKEKIQVSASGTAAQHIVIRGIADPATGALPILEANGAVEDPSTDWRSPVLSDFGMITVSPRKSSYIYGQPGVSFVDIENLDIRDAYYTTNNSITYTDQTGKVRPWDSFACGVYVEWALDFALRGCEISNCGNGFFANSKNGSVQSSARLLVEKNYFHDNSLPYTTDPNTGAVLSNGYHEHHIYTECAGITIQFNKFGRLHAGAHGVAIKDRSSGEVIRYNEFDMTEESNVLALLDPQGGAGYIELQPHYLDSYVYGNLVTIETYATDTDLFWWGSYNGSNQYGALHRGTLYFYNNTVVVHHGKVGLFFLPSTTYTGSSKTYENVDCRNNIFYVDQTYQTNVYNALHWSTGGATNGGGDINLGVNWVSPGTSKDTPGHAYGGLLNGTANSLVGDSAGANDAHFVSLASHDYHALTTANTIDVGGALAAAALPANDDVLEYVAPLSSQPRVQKGAKSDLGALESGGTGTPTPTPSPGPTITPTPTPTSTPSPTITPTPTPVGNPSPRPQAVNVSTRGRVQSGDEVLIGGFILSGTDPKQVIIRAIGPSLLQSGLSGALSDTTLELYDSAGRLLASNDNWSESQEAAITATSLAPSSPLESAILTTLDSGAAYTAIVRGKDGSSGIGLVEVFDLGTTANSKLANISTRGFVNTGDNVMIGGFIVGGNVGQPTNVVIRAMGPSLAKAGVTDPLQDPILAVYDSNGSLIGMNDDWRDAQPEIVTKGLAPTDDRESALYESLSPGTYTAIVRGANESTGIALVELYDVN